MAKTSSFLTLVVLHISATTYVFAQYGPPSQQQNSIVAPIPPGITEQQLYGNLAPFDQFAKGYYGNGLPATVQMQRVDEPEQQMPVEEVTQQGTDQTLDHQLPDDQLQSPQVNLNKEIHAYATKKKITTVNNRLLHRYVKNLLVNTLFNTNLQKVNHQKYINQLVNNLQETHQPKLAVKYVRQDSVQHFLDRNELPQVEEQRQDNTMPPIILPAVAEKIGYDGQSLGTTTGNGGAGAAAALPAPAAVGVYNSYMNNNFGSGGNQTSGQNGGTAVYGMPQQPAAAPQPAQPSAFGMPLNSNGFFGGASLPSPGQPGFPAQQNMPNSSTSMTMNNSTNVVNGQNALPFPGSNAPPASGGNGVMPSTNNNGFGGQNSGGGTAMYGMPQQPSVSMSQPAQPSAYGMPLNSNGFFGARLPSPSQSSFPVQQQNMPNSSTSLTMDNSTNGGMGSGQNALPFPGSIAQQMSGNGAMPINTSMEQSALPFPAALAPQNGNTGMGNSASNNSAGGMFNGAPQPLLLLRPNTDSNSMMLLPSPNGQDFTTTTPPAPATQSNAMFMIDMSADLPKPGGNSFGVREMAFNVNQQQQPGSNNLGFGRIAASPPGRDAPINGFSPWRPQRQQQQLLPPRNFMWQQRMDNGQNIPAAPLQISIRAA